MRPNSPVTHVTMIYSHPGPSPHLKHSYRMWDIFSLENLRKFANITIDRIVVDVKAAEADAIPVAYKLANDEIQATRDML